MDGNKCILQLRGLRPFFSPKYDLRKHPNFRFTAEFNKRNAFDPAVLVSTRLKVTPDELFTVYQADAPDETSINEYSDNEDIDADIFNYDDLDDPDAFA